MSLPAVPVLPRGHIQHTPSPATRAMTSTPDSGTLHPTTGLRRDSSTPSPLASSAHTLRVRKCGSLDPTDLPVLTNARRYIDSNQPAFKKHCFSKHAPSTYRCPSCLKEYRDLQSLVAHCETTSRKCRIQRSDAFAWFIHNVTGGYLDASKRNKKGEVLYEASLPSDFQDVRKAKDVKKFW